MKVVGYTQTLAPSVVLILCLLPFLFLLLYVHLCLSP